MAKKVIIIGCGQLGSRHLQSIAKIDEPLEIKVVEPNNDNQRIGAERLSEVLPQNNKINIEWLETLEKLNGGSDLTIVATTSRGRAEIITKLVDRGHKRFLIEKMVCQSKGEYESILEAFENQQAKGWVDCTRRYFPFYERIIPLMENEKNLIFNVTGGNHGLGSNAIHLLDLFWWIGGMSKNLKLNGDYLTPTLLPNRRGSDLIELAGTIIASTPEGSFASISFHHENDASILINMTSDNYRIFVNETNDKALIASKENNWQWEEHAFETVYSSNLTSKIALSIFETDSCNLPSLQESFLLHDELFRIFNHHIKRITGRDEGFCPIT
jgi:hypothetical protein